MYNFISIEEFKKMQIKDRSIFSGGPSRGLEGATTPVGANLAKLRMKSALFGPRLEAPAPVSKDFWRHP